VYGGGAAEIACSLAVEEAAVKVFCDSLMPKGVDSETTMPIADYPDVEPWLRAIRHASIC
jgi:hypothetical protein